MAATGLQINWINVSYAGITIDRVTNVTISQGGQLASFAGDNNRYPVCAVNTMNNPRISVTSGDIAVLMGFTAGTTGIFDATQLDALGSSGGNILFAMNNCAHETSDDNGPFSQFATGTASFLAFAPDGSTNPLAFTRS